MNAEFNDYIKDYRKNCDSALSLSGESSAFFAEYKALKLKEWLPERIKIEQKILDFGCGDGMMTGFMQALFNRASLYGVDPSQESITQAQLQYPTIKFSTNSEQSTDLNFESNSFDIIYSAGTFHHIPFEAHYAYYQELKRILKPGGIFILLELNPLNPLTVITFKRNPIDKNATMMTPWYSRKISKKVFNTISTKFYCFYPNPLRFMRFTEKYMTKIPFGALYAVLCKK